MRIILSLFLSLLATALFAQVEGRGVWCTPISFDISEEDFFKQFTVTPVRGNFYLGMMFDGGGVISHIPIINNDVVTMPGARTGSYMTDGEFIYLGNLGSKERLNRKSLVLNTAGLTAQCEVFNSKSAFDAKTVQLRSSIQAEYNRQLRGNRI